MVDAIAIYGMGVSGQASVNFAHEHGMTVYAWDDNADMRQAMAQTWPAHKVSWCDFLHQGLPKDVGYLLFSPGVPWNGQDEQHPAVRLARLAQNKDIAVGCDVDFLLRHHALPLTAKLYALTGTNGKTSLVHWLAEITKACGHSAIALGNNGVAALGQKRHYTHYFFELSSYQLDLIAQAAFFRTALLNISVDHLERYGTLSAYARSKAKIAKLIAPQPAQRFVYSVDDPDTRQIGEYTPYALACSAQTPLKQGVYLDQGCLFDQRVGEPTARHCVLDFREFPWLNNRQHARNLMLAYALLVGDVLPDDPVQAATLFTTSAQQAFEALSFDHRQNPVAYLPGVLFVDDSKATNAIATKDALEQFRQVHWIVGGQAKIGGFAELGQDFAHVQGVYTIGSGARELENYLSQYSVLKRKIEPCGTLQQAIKRLASRLRYKPEAPETVLFSPACASFDQFANYVQRGQAFQQTLVQQWPEVKYFTRSPATLALWKELHHGLA